MNPGFDPKEIAKIKEKCKVAKKPFVYREDAEKDEEQANFHFVGKFDGKEVVYDAFIYTLELEYFLNIFEEAKEMVIELHPQYADADFDAEEGEHLDILDQTMEELAKDSAFDVQEFMETDTDVEYGVSLDVCLKVPEITDEVVASFVETFLEGSFQTDTTFYSFTLE